MTTKEFIINIANGNLKKNDILNYVLNCPDKQALVDDLYWSDKACEISTGKPLVCEDDKILLIYDAINIICEEYQLKPLGEYQDGCCRSVLSIIEIPQDIKLRKFEIYLEIAYNHKLISINQKKLIFNGSNALLAYFCGKIFCGDRTVINSFDGEINCIVGRHNLLSRFPEKSLERLFGKKRLSQSRSQLFEKPEKSAPKAPPGTDIVDEIYSEAEKKWENESVR